MSAPGCTCRPGIRCPPCAQVGAAAVRLLTHPHRARLGGSRATSDPVMWADTLTSMHDCRVALNVARGVPLELIDQCGGYAK